MIVISKLLNVNRLLMVSNCWMTWLCLRSNDPRFATVALLTTFIIFTVSWIDFLRSHCPRLLRNSPTLDFPVRCLRRNHKFTVRICLWRHWCYWLFDGGWCGDVRRNLVIKNEIFGFWQLLRTDILQMIWITTAKIQFMDVIIGKFGISW